MNISTDIMSLAAVVAAYVGVIKTLFAGTKYSSLASKIAPLTALIIAAAFVLVPASVQNTLLTISLVGLTAAGAYHYVKPPVNNATDATDAPTAK